MYWFDKSDLMAEYEPLEIDTYNHSGINLQDAFIMLCWLKYAAAIGDLSYLKISEQPVSKLQGLPNRPPFQPADPD